MKILKEALKEDLGNEDITTNSIVPTTVKAKAVIIAKESGVIAGIDIAREVFMSLDRKIVFKKRVNEGESVKEGKTIAEIEGRARAILVGERVALNFLQRLSGIATVTSRFVKLAGKSKILDTRKTTPCLRALEKYAVRIGGGLNHRFNLNEGILIKDNHIKIAGSVREAVRMARETGNKIEVEVKNMNELEEAMSGGVDTVLLDNMSIKDIRKCTKFVDGRAKVEVSGGVNLENIKEIAGTGVDYISVGALTHSAEALDISLEIIGVRKK